jgi:putative ABC transport system permease protein
MFSYHLRLALKSLRRTPGIAALMIAAIGLGVGVCVTTLTVWLLMSSNPVQHRNDVLYSVTLDSWDPNQPMYPKSPHLPPNQVTYRDAMAMLESDIPTRAVAMRKGSFVLDPKHSEGAKPFQILARFTQSDFFSMFDVPFQYGGSWDARADENSPPIVVVSREINRKLFGGQDSVGRVIELDGKEYKIVGVLDEWSPMPKVYDLTNGAFDVPEDVFLPFDIGIKLKMHGAGNTNCWRNQTLNTYEEFLQSDCVWIQFWAELPDRERVEQFKSFIDNYVREQKELGRFERPLNNHLRRPDEWLEVNEVVRDDNRVLVGLSFMFLSVCLLNMIGLLLAKFLGAAPVVGLRRALGASRKEIFNQHLVEVGVIGIAGGLAGIVFAALGLFAVRRMHDNYDALTRLDVSMGLIALAIALLSGLLAGLYPTWRICRTQPATYLKTQ